MQGSVAGWGNSKMGLNYSTIVVEVAWIIYGTEKSAKNKEISC